MKKVFLVFAVALLALCVSSCSKSDDNESNNVYSLDIRPSNISVKIGNKTYASIKTENIELCNVKVDNDFIADCELSGNNIVINPKHIGKTFAIVSLNKLKIKLNIEVLGTYENLCGSPIIMIGSSYKEVKDSISKLNGITIHDYITNMKSICYSENTSENHHFDYMYFFENDKLKAISINAPSYKFLNISKYKQDISETYDYIRTDKINSSVNHSIYKYKDNINVISCEELITNNGLEYYNLNINISDDMSFLLNTYNFRIDGNPNYIN